MIRIEPWGPLYNSINIIRALRKNLRNLGGSKKTANPRKSHRCAAGSVLILCLRRVCHAEDRGMAFRI